tara:strand:- start:98 stop:1018 length:921 start_codon:yes stop_codon:yes gene_type:complete
LDLIPSKTKKTKVMNRTEQIKTAFAVNSLFKIQVLFLWDLIFSLIVKPKTNTWHANKAKMGLWLLMPWLKTPFCIFNLKGNKKLKFAAFSSLPLVDCPGAGKCKSFCYSLKAWRFPAAFFRQLQNSFLQRYLWYRIEAAFLALPQNVTLRLFVDGDFRNLQNLRQWMDLIRKRPDVKVYGYSKSWKEFVQLDNFGKYAWPENYLVNASSGSRHEHTGIANAFKSLSVCRGSFEAVQVSKHWMQSGAYQGKDKPGNLGYRKEIREAFKNIGQKVFACPGTCNNCMSDGKHACGSQAMSGVTIAIGIH